MKKEILKLAQHRLERSRDSFREAILLLESASFNGALNRFYYAAFYGARALLATKELDSSKHSGVISLFHANLVKSGAFDPEKAKALSRSFEERQDSDYEDFALPTRDQVERVRNQVRDFIDECEKLLKELGLKTDN